MTNTTILGLGAMGARIAARLVEAGQSVTVWNRSLEMAERVASEVPVTVAPTPRAAVADAEIVISLVTDDEASRTLWLDPDRGVLVAMPPDAIAIEASTVTQAMARELGDAAVSRGVDFLEAPLVGSRPQAEAGALFVLVGGSHDVLERARPVIDAYAGGIRHVGAVGNAASMKLAINGLFAVQVAAYAEIVGMLDRSDVPIDTAIEILTHLPITSPGLQRILGLFAERNFSPNFPIPLVAKDLGYLEALATELGAELPVAAVTRGVYVAGAAGDQASLDIAGIADRYLV